MPAAIFRHMLAKCLVSLETSVREKIEVKLAATGGYARVTDGCAANGQARIPASKIVLIRPQNMTPQHGRTWTSRSLLLERDCGFGAKFLGKIFVFFGQNGFLDGLESHSALLWSLIVFVDNHVRWIF